MTTATATRVKATRPEADAPSEFSAWVAEMRRTGEIVIDVAGAMTRLMNLVPKDGTPAERAEAFIELARFFGLRPPYSGRMNRSCKGSIVAVGS